MNHFIMISTMIRLLILLITICLSAGMHGQDIDSLKVASFFQYYENDQYEQAITIGTELLNEMGTASKNNEDYLNVLSILADCHYYCDEIERAIELGVQAVELSRNIFGEEHPDYATALNDLARYYYDYGDNEKALMLYTQALKIRKKILGEKHLDCAYSMCNLAGCYDELGNYSKAIELGTEAMDIFKKELGKEHPDYLSSLGNLAIYHDKFGEYKEALELNKQVVKIKEKVLGEEHPDYASSISSLAINYSHLGDYKRAIELGQQALNIRKKTLGEEHLDYANSLNNLAKAYEGLGNYSKAIELGTQALKIVKKNLGEEHPRYAIYLNNLASAYGNMGNYTKAIELGTQSLVIRERTSGIEHPDYARSLSLLATCYYDLGDYATALEYETQAMEILKKVLGTDYPDYALSLNGISGCYAALGNYDEAIRLGNEALETTKNVFGSEHRNYAISMLNLSSYYSEIGNYSEAIKLGAQATDILKNVLGPEHISYAMSLSRLADYYDHIGNYDEAIQLGEESLDIIKTQLGVKHPDYASSLISLASYYYHINYYHESIQLNKEALKIVKKYQGTDNLNYAMLLNNIANDYMGLGKYKKAIPLLKKTLEIRKILYGTYHPLYANSLNNLACAYKDKGDTGEAIRLGTIAVNISKDLNKDNHYYDNKSIFFLANLSFWQYEVGNNEDAVALIKEYLQLVRNDILTTFLGLTANERLMYWGQYNYNFSDYAPKVIIDSSLPDAASILYDNISLFAKGLLLTTEVEITKLIQESGDTEALQLYSELQRNRKVLSEQYSKTLDESNIDCDSLEHVTAYLERELASRVKEIGDYTQNLSITWRDVQSKLGENDIAIEFLSYPENDSITAYVALTLCKNDSAPTLTPLFTNLQLIDVASDDDTYQNVAADRLIWGTLAPRLERKSHVYFSAAGMLHNIGIEYLPSMEGKDCYRLSSTRELVTHKPSEGGKSATLFGGIDYDATYASLRSTAKNEPSATYLADNTMTIPVGLNRGGFNYSTMRGTRYSVSRLPHSKTEIQEISAFLKKNGFFVQDCDTIRATEGSFKALSGQRKSLIHISTHGFYYDEDEAENKAKHMRMMLMGENRPTNIEDQSLLRCGLCFAGANQAFTGDSLPADGQDDGILNALEIAQMDLRGLDLVVLSACQTALGDIIVGQGVFGLQRGFKKAGANSILMSLWEVDDEVTSKFMIEFYRQWTSGKTKMEALKMAQSVIKQEYQDPRHWAAFILLDALD